MRHVRQIKELIAQGEGSKAREALVGLLELGPKNVEALKLQAGIVAGEGRFQEERAVWEKIISIDNEDEDAISYFYRSHLEERENFYFTDDLPRGGKRFLAYPRGVIRSSLIGMLGCGIFLMANYWITQRAVAVPVYIALPTFFVLVVVPWLMIVFSYLRHLQEIILSSEGIALITRMRSYLLTWQQIESIHIASNQFGERVFLTLVFMPKDAREPIIELDISESSSVVRAKTFFVRDVIRHFGDVRYSARDGLNIYPGKSVTF